MQINKGSNMLLQISNSKANRKKSIYIKNAQLGFVWITVSILTNEQAGSPVSLGWVIIDPLVEDAEDHVAKHTKEEDEWGKKLTQDVERLFEVSAV